MSRISEEYRFHNNELMLYSNFVEYENNWMSSK